MRITFLGTGTSTGVPVLTCECAVCTSDDPRDIRLRPSVMLEWDGASVIIDSSPDFRQQALRYGISRVDAVLYTHSHADHLLGLDDLRIYNWVQGGAIPVFGTGDTLDALQRTFWYAFSDEPSQSTRPTVGLNVIEAPFELLGAEVIPIPLMHGSMPIIGYRIGTFAYITDASLIPPASIKMLTGLNTLVLNALRERPHPMHLNIDGAVELARLIGAKHTYFTHMSHEVHFGTTSDRLPEGIELAYDGLICEVP